MCVIIVMSHVMLMGFKVKLFSVRDGFLLHWGYSVASITKYIPNQFERVFIIPEWTKFEQEKHEKLQLVNELKERKAKG